MTITLRLIALLLFSCAGLIVWFTFISVTGEFNLSLDSENFFGAVSAFISASISSLLISPKIYLLEKRRINHLKAFGYGIMITLLSYLIGSFIFSIEIIGLEFFSIQDYLLLGLYGFIYSIIIMSPGIVLGGLTGNLFFYFSNITKPETN